MFKNAGFTRFKYLALGLGLVLSYVLTSGLMGQKPIDLLQAIQNRQFSDVRQLVKHGADVNLTTNEGATPLHFAAQTGQLASVHLLLQEGANVRALYQDQWMPLHFAAQHGHVDVAKLLLDFGAPINGQKGKGDALAYRGSRTPTTDGRISVDPRSKS